MRAENRRVIYNDDSDQQYQGYEGYGYQIETEQDFIDSRTTPTFNTHVDTYVWCVGNGADPPWGSDYDKWWPCLGSPERASDLIVKACHEKGMEVWASLRMNDIHDSFRAKTLAEATDPLKAQHPEYLIGRQEDRSLPEPLTERYLWTAFNYARPEVRQYRLDYIQRNAARHDFDGYELDFTRFIWDFPLGEEEQHAHLMTDMIRQIRSILNDIGEQRGRPYLLVVHALDSLRTSMAMGLDICQWLEEGLVDILVPGMGYMPYVVPLDEWLELGDCYDVSVYPSLNTNTFVGEHLQDQGIPLINDCIRASAAYYWQEGASGLYIFNLFCQEDKNVASTERDAVYRPLKEIGEPGLLVGKNKLYMIQPVDDGGFCHHGSEATPLPIVLGAKEHKLRLPMGPDARNSKARVRIRAITTGGSKDATVWFRLNHRLLTTVRAQDSYEAQAPKNTLRCGDNELAIWCDTDRNSGNPIVVERVLVPVEYGS